MDKLLGLLLDSVIQYLVNHPDDIAKLIELEMNKLLAAAQDASKAQ